MKILLITNLFPPHANGHHEEHCRETVNALRERGHEVTVLTSDYRAHEFETDHENGVHRFLRLWSKQSHAGLSIKERFDIERYNKSVLKDEIDAFSPDVLQITNMGGFTRSFMNFLQKLEIPRVFEVSDYWLVKTAEDGDSELDLDAEAVVNPHEQKKGFHPLNEVVQFVSKLSPNASPKRFSWDGLYFCSSYLKQATARMGYGVKDADVIPWSVDVEQVERKKQYRSRKRLLWVGGLNDDRDPMTAIEALALLNEKGYSDFSLDIYGKSEPEYLRRLLSRVSQLGLHNQVFINQLDGEEARSIYASHDVLLYTSACGDPFPMTPVKAMAAGLPVIVAEDGGSCDLVKEDFNGFVYKSRSPQSLADRIEAWSKMEDAGKIFARNGLDFVSRSLNRERIVRQIEGCLNRALSHN